MMDGQGLNNQVQALQSMLNEQSTRLDLFPVLVTAGTRGIEVRRLTDARNRLYLLCRQLEQELSGFALSMQTAAPQHYREDKWERFDGIKSRAIALAADCLAFDHTVKCRNATLAAKYMHLFDATDICAAADFMIEEYSRKVGKPRTHYALLSGSAYFQPEISAIHLSYTGLNIWGLNRTAHEFGHQWAEEHASGNTGAQNNFLENVKETWASAIAKELFADIIATFMMGPAYAYSCLLLDFNPINRKSSGNHPSHDLRAHCILGVLEKLVEKIDDPSGPRMRHEMTNLKLFWSEARGIAGASGEPASLKNLNVGVSLVLKQLKREIPTAQFANASSAFAVKGALEQYTDLIGRADTVSILNGAWLARLEVGTAGVAKLERAGLRMLLRVGSALEQAG